MGRRDPDFSADGVFLPDDIAAMAKAFRVACIQVGALSDRTEVRHAMAFLIAHHYELGLRQIDFMAKVAARLGRTIAPDYQPPTFFG